MNNEIQSQNSKLKFLLEQIKEIGYTNAITKFLENILHMIIDLIKKRAV